MSIIKLSTYSRTKKKINQLNPFYPEFLFTSSFTGIVLDKLNDTAGFTPSFTTTLTGVNEYVGYTGDFGGYLNFAIRVYYEDGANKRYRYYVCMIRKSDKRVQKLSIEKIVPSTIGELTFKSYYYDAGRVYMNYTDTNLGTNHYIYYDYQTDSFSAIQSGQYTTGNLMTASSVSYEGYALWIRAWVLNQIPNYYYGINVTM